MYITKVFCLCRKGEHRQHNMAL